MDKPIILYPAVYVLALENGCYYVGMTHDLNRRLSQHFSGTGALWTRLHKPKSVEKVIYPAIEEDLENKITREYMNMYGEDKVKGGRYCSVKVKLCRDCQTTISPQYIYCMLCAKDRGLIF